MQSLREKPLPLRCWWSVLTVPLLAACGNELALDPQGPGAVQIASSWWIMYWTAVAVCLIVFAILFAAVWRRRQAAEHPQAEARGKAVVLWGGAVIPLLLLVATTVLILLGMRWLDAAPPRSEAHTSELQSR